LPLADSRTPRIIASIVVQSLTQTTLEQADRTPILPTVHIRQSRYLKGLCISPLTLRVAQLPGLTDATPEGETVYSLANKHVAIIPQIESRVGIRNIDAIMRMEQVDAVMLGGAFQVLWV
jgi:hypothetical protein